MWYKTIIEFENHKSLLYPRIFLDKAFETYYHCIYMHTFGFWQLAKSVMPFPFIVKNDIFTDPERQKVQMAQSLIAHLIYYIDQTKKKLRIKEN